MDISVEIVAGTDIGSSSVKVNGGDQSHVITDEEVAAWGLDDHTLKAAVEKYFGKRPDDVFLHSPTPWNDLYKKYGWSEVTTGLKVYEAKIVKAEADPTTVATRKFTNDSSVATTFNCAISETVTDTALTNWSKTETFSATGTVKYNFGVPGWEASLALGYTYAWGQGGSESKAITVGSSTGLMVTLQPGQSVDALLQAERGKIEVGIVYLLGLSGHLAVNYTDSYKGHHFWGLDLATVMKAAGIENTRDAVTELTFEYYSGATVVVTDAATGQHVALASPHAVPGT